MARQMAPLCTICWETMITKVQRCGPCGHLFHSSCISRWFDNRRQKTCPVCRQVVMSEQRCVANVSPLVIADLGRQILSKMDVGVLQKWEQEYRVKVVELESESSALTGLLCKTADALRVTNRAVAAIGEAVTEIKKAEKEKRLKRAREECDKIRKEAKQQDNNKPFNPARSPRKPYTPRRRSSGEGEAGTSSGSSPLVPTADREAMFAALGRSTYDQQRTEPGKGSFRYFD